MRRAHHKSRNGCSACKRRRIKCDETHPRCMNCSKRELRCVYVPQRHPLNDCLSRPKFQAQPLPLSLPLNLEDDSFEATFDPPPLSPTASALPFTQDMFGPAGVVQALPAPSLPISELELLHHFLTETTKTFREADRMVKLWNVDGVRLALRHTWLMRGMLAIAALHLSVLRPEECDSYFAIAQGHQSQALADFGLEYSGPDKFNIEAAFMFSSLVPVFATAASCHPSSSQNEVIRPETAVVEWVQLVRGVRVVLGASFGSIRTSPLVGLMISEYRCCTDQVYYTNDPEVDLRLDILLSLCSPPSSPETKSTLHTIYSEGGISLTTEQAEAYRETVIALRKCFHLVYRPEPLECKIGVILTWPGVMPAAYVTLLQENEPLALSILAHFCVLMGHIDVWWMKGWPVRLLGTIESLMEPKWRSWIQWPISIMRQ